MPVSSGQWLSHVWLFTTPWTVARQSSLSFTMSWSLLRLMSIESMMPFNSSHPLSSPSPPAPQSLPASGSFPMSQLFTWGGQSIGVSASASVLPMNTQDWFPLVLTDLISLLSKGLSRVFSSTTLWKHQFFSAQPSLWSNSHHLYMTNHSFDHLDLCWQSDVSASWYAMFVRFSSKEQAFFNSMAAVTVPSDFGVQENKVCNYFHCFPIYLSWSDGTRCHDLSFLNVEF